MGVGQPGQASEDVGHGGYYDVDDGHVSHDDGRYDDGYDCVGVPLKLSKVVEMAEK